MNNELIALLSVILICFLLMALMIVRAPKLDQTDEPERDYNDPENEDPIAGCFFSFKMVALGTLIYAIYHFIRFLA